MPQEKNVEAAAPPVGLLTTAELAPLIRKTERTCQVWTKRGYIPAIKIGRSVLYSWPDVQAALKKFTVNASAGGAS